MWPSLGETTKNTGIGRIVHAQHQYLPELGVELVSRPDQTEVFACHTRKGDVAPRVDVLHTHGMYFSDIPHEPYASWHRHANSEILRAARQAVVVTVPSDWVAEPFRRDMRLEPTIIGHGIEPEEWSPGTDGGYLLWNKNRNLDVCDPTPAFELSKKGHKVISTWAPVGKDPTYMFQVIGPQSWEKMKELVRNAHIYLATTRETFGVGTLEALAAGIPVLGYSWGGTADIVRHQQDGYLATPGDIEDLERGLTWIEEHWQGVSDSAMQRAKEFSWEKCMAQYAALYARVAEQLQSEQHRVAVVIPCHNYAGYLRDALDTILAQSYPADEIVVVDDGSVDDTASVAEDYEVNPNFKFIRNEKALGVAAARNLGIEATSAELVVCLDADDMLDPRYLQICRSRMMQRRELGIAYTGLDVHYPNGEVRKFSWPPPFSWETQSTQHVPPNNCVPSASMFRRSMWLRAGGYRQEYAPGEDAEFWTRGLSIGFDAERVTDLPLFHYRAHDGSASRTKVYVATNEHHPWMLDRVFPMAVPDLQAPIRIRCYAEPLVTVILQDRSGSMEDLAEAVEDILGQHVRDWELIVHSRHSILPLNIRYPFLRWAGSLAQAKAKAKGPLLLITQSGLPLKPDHLMDGLHTVVKREGLQGSIFEEGTMAGCCGGNAEPVLRAKRQIEAVEGSLAEGLKIPSFPNGTKAVRMEFVGSRAGAVTYHGKAGRTYRGGSSPLHRFADVHPEDAFSLLQTGTWRMVEAPPSPVTEEV